MIKMHKKEFDQLINDITDSLFEGYEFTLLQKIREWKSMDNHPAILNEPPIEKDLTVVDPKSHLQVADENLPIGDPEWAPGNQTELGMALKQMTNIVPDGQREWFYKKVKRLVDACLDKEDEARTKPRLGEQ